MPDAPLSLQAPPGATRRERRAHARAVRKELERALRPQLGGASPRRHRPALTAVAALLTLGVGASEAAAAVTATVSGAAPDKLLTVTTTAGSGVVVTCGPGGNVKVNGADPSPATPCSQLGRASITGDGAANSIDLTALDDPPFQDDVVVRTAGGAGADSILSGGGPDEEVTGGAGNDTIAGSFFTLVESADASMTLTGTSLSSPALGTDVIRSDRGGMLEARLTGGASANVLDASGWPDNPNLRGVALDGGGGNDTLKASPEDTTMTGGAGSDTLVQDGAFGAVVVREQVSGITTLTDTGLTTGPGNDTYSGGSPSYAVLTGTGAGNHDVNVRAFSGHAEVIGGAGNDTLRGSGSVSPFGGRDTLTGGLGNDSLLGTPGGPVGIHETANAHMTLTDGSLTGVGTDTLADAAFATLVGGAGDHTIDASAFSGRSVLNGRAGNDTVRGGPANDTLAAELGNDLLVAGGGTDQLGSRAGPLDSPAGSVTLTNALLTSTGIGTDTISGFERAELNGSPGADTMDASAFTANGAPSVMFEAREGADSLVGSPGGDYFVGGDGIDTMRGMGGDDRVFDLGRPFTPNLISGDGGNDTIEAESFNETIHGGAGVDRLGLYAETGPLTLTDTSVTEEPGSTSTLSGFERGELYGNNLPNDIDVSGFTGSGGVNMFTAGGDDTLTVSGGLANDTIDGGDGIDRVAAAGDFDFKLTDTRLESPGGMGLDTLTDVEAVSLTGGAGANVLDASASTTRTTTLIGGGGNDTLRGGALADSLNGEGGVDDFFGNAGDDTLFTQDSLAEAMIFCGSGTNMVTADAADTLAADCPARPTVPGGGGGDPTVPGGGGDPPPLTPPVTPPVPVAPPSPDPTAGLRDACLDLPPKIRERVRKVKGGGQAILAISRSSDPTQPLKLTAKGRRLRIRSATFAVNGKAVPSSGRSGSAPLSSLKLGARNKITVTITLADGKTITVTQLITVRGCPPPPVKCQRLADGAQITCSSTVPKRIRRVQLALTGPAGQTARGRARVTRKRRASHGTYTITFRPAGPLPPGRYVFTQIGTSARKGEKLLAVRVLTLT